MFNFLLLLLLLIMLFLDFNVRTGIVEFDVAVKLWIQGLLQLLLLLLLLAWPTFSNSQNVLF